MYQHDENFIDIHENTDEDLSTLQYQEQQNYQQDIKGAKSAKVIGQMEDAEGAAADDVPSSMHPSDQLMITDVATPVEVDHQRNALIASELTFEKVATDNNNFNQDDDYKIVQNIEKENMDS